MSIGQELLDVPMAEMITSLGLAISRAQFELDKTSLEVAKIMAGQKFDSLNADGTTNHDTQILVDFGGDRPLSMLELGFTPSFYHFTDTIVEVKVSIKIAIETTSSFSTFHGSAESGFAMFYGTATVNTVSASFANKYNYSAEGSSLLRTKIAPVPPPAILEQRIRALITAP
jgi:hypothetical protein